MFQLEKSKTYVHQLLIQTSSLCNRNLPIHLFLIGKTPFESWTILCHIVKMLKYFLSIYNLYNTKLLLYGVQKYSISYFFACHKVCENGENIQHCQFMWFQKVFIENNTRYNFCNSIFCNLGEVAKKQKLDHPEN